MRRALAHPAQRPNRYRACGVEPEPRRRRDAASAAPVNANTLNLSNLLGADAAPTQLTATGTVQQDGQSFTYQVDATLQAMIDQQHLQHATMS